MQKDERESIMANAGFLVMRPFNALFFCIFAVLILILIVASIFLNKKSVETRKKVLVIASVITLIGFVLYKIALSQDPEFDELRRSVGMGGFNWWGELPLQLCNVNMILIPIAVLLDRRELLAFCFFVGPLGALMALTMPGMEFNGFSILLPRMLGYYGTHFLIVIEGLAVATLGLYRPKFKDLPRIVLTILIIAFVVFLINMAMRLTGLYPSANYFFAVETEGNPILELFHSFLPYPFLYLLPCTLILVPYMALVTLGFYIGDRVRGKKEN
jgi:hypothetical integral membrane protein (TIGR02206 family)